MKKTRKVIMSLLLVLALVGVPVSQAMATSYDVSEDWSSQELYPGDDLTGIAEDVSVTQDGEDVLIDNGSWTNESDEFVYLATKEDGSISLTEAGYSLVMEGGSSKGEDDKEAFGYPEGEKVTIVADDPEEGYVFTGWLFESEKPVEEENESEIEIEIEDPSAPTTTFIMPAEALTVTAVFEEAALIEAETEEATPVEVETEAAVPAEIGTEEAAPVKIEVEETAPVEAGTEEAAPVEAGTEEEVPVEVVEIEETEPAEVGSEEVVVIGEEEIVTIEDVQEVPAGQEEAVPEETEEPAAIEESEEESEVIESGTESPVNTLAGDPVTPESPTLTANENGVEVSLSELTFDPDENTFTFTASAIDPSTDEVRYVFTGWSAYYEENEERTIVNLEGQTDIEENAELSFSVADIGAVEITVTANYDRLYQIKVEGGEVVDRDENDNWVLPGTEFWVLPGTELKGITIQAVEPENDEQMPRLEASTDDPDMTPDIYFEVQENKIQNISFVMPESDVTLKVIYEPCLEEQETGEIPSTGDQETTDDGGSDDSNAGSDEDGGSDDTNDEEAVPPTLLAGGNAVSLGEPVLNEAGDAWTFTAKAENPSGGSSRFVFAGWSATYEENGETKTIMLGGQTDSEEAELSIPAEVGAVTITLTANYDQLYQIIIEGGEVVGWGENDYWVLPGTELKDITIRPVLLNGETFVRWELSTQGLSEGLVILGFDSDTETQDISFTMPESNVILSVISETSASGTGDGDDDTANTSDPVLTAYKVTVENGTAPYAEYYPGEIVTITADYPSENQEFNAWSLQEGQAELENVNKSETTFTMPESDVTVAATYKNGPTYYIDGITEGATYEPEERLTFTAVGGGMDNTDPNPGDIRYVPASYTIGDVSNSWSEAPYTTSMSIKKEGEYTLTVCFTKQVWNGSAWEADGTTAVAAVTFYIQASEENEAVETGDTTPVTMIVVIAVLACLIFVILLVVFIRRRRSANE